MSYCRSDPALQRPAVYRETNIPTKSTDLLRGERLRVGVHRGGFVGQVVMVLLWNLPRGRVGVLRRKQRELGYVMKYQQKEELVTEIYSLRNLEARNQC